MNTKEQRFWFEYEDENENDQELFIHFEVVIQTGEFTFNVYLNDAMREDVWWLVKSLNPSIYKDIENEVYSRSQKLREEAA